MSIFPLTFVAWIAMGVVECVWAKSLKPGRSRGAMPPRTARTGRPKVSSQRATKRLHSKLDEANTVKPPFRQTGAERAGTHLAAAAWRIVAAWRDCRKHCHARRQQKTQPFSKQHKTPDKSRTIKWFRK